MCMYRVDRSEIRIVHGRSGLIMFYFFIYFIDLNNKSNILKKGFDGENISFDVNNISFLEIFQDFFFHLLRYVHLKR